MNTFYFSHDYNARTNEKIKRLIRKYGYEGYGIYWAIIEDLYNNANALRFECDSIAYEMRVDEDKIRSIITDFGLFEIDGEIFRSESVERRMNERFNKSIKARKSAEKRWNNANAMRTHSERNAIKENKGKEIKDIKDIKEKLLADLEILPDVYIEKIIEVYHFHNKILMKREDVLKFWEIHKTFNFDLNFDNKTYTSKEKVYNHFMYWIKNQKYESANHKTESENRMQQYQDYVNQFRGDFSHEK